MGAAESGGTCAVCEADLSGHPMFQLRSYDGVVLVICEQCAETELQVMSLWRQQHPEDGPEEG